MVAAMLIIICSLAVILTPVAISEGLIPIPQPVPLSMEQQWDMKRVEKLEGQIKDLREALRAMNNRITKDNRQDDQLSEEKLAEIDALWSKVNELDNRILPPDSFDGDASRRSRDLFGK
jgi:hypothetical protein